MSISSNKSIFSVSLSITDKHSCVERYQTRMNNSMTLLVWLKDVNNHYIFAMYVISTGSFPNTSLTFYFGFTHITVGPKIQLFCGVRLLTSVYPYVHNVIAIKLLCHDMRIFLLSIITIIISWLYSLNFVNGGLPNAEHHCVACTVKVNIK